MREWRERERGEIAKVSSEGFDLLGGAYAFEGGDTGERSETVVGVVVFDAECPADGHAVHSGCYSVSYRGIETCCSG